jgi:hypothetical protein
MSHTPAALDVNVGGALSDTLRSVLLFLPRALAFVVILVVGWLAARFLGKLLHKVLTRVGFDRAVRRGGVGTLLNRTGIDPAGAVAKLAYYALLLLVLQLAFGVWGANPVSALITAVIAWLPRAFVAIIIVLVASGIATAVRDIVSSALGGLSYGRTLANVASWFIIGIGVIAALTQVGIATAVTTPILVAVLATIAGILVVGVGGGLVRPMQARWERWLDHAERESGTISAQARAYSASQRQAATTPAGPAGAAPAGAVPAGDGLVAAAAEPYPPVHGGPLGGASAAEEQEAERTQPVTYSTGQHDPYPPRPRDPDPTEPAPVYLGGADDPADIERTQVLPTIGERHSAPE